MLVNLKLVVKMGTVGRCVFACVVCYNVWCDGDQTSMASYWTQHGSECQLDVS